MKCETCGQRRQTPMRLLLSVADKTTSYGFVALLCWMARSSPVVAQAPTWFDLASALWVAQWLCSIVFALGLMVSAVMLVVVVAAYFLEPDFLSRPV